MPATLLYDTGSSITAISLKTFRKIPVCKRPAKIPIMYQARCASGQSLNVLGCYNLKYEIFGQEVIHPTVVCRNLKMEGLFGDDFIKAHGLGYDARSGEVFLQPPVTKLARTKKEVYLPPRSQTLVKLDAPSSSKLQHVTINVVDAKAIFSDEYLVQNTGKGIPVYLTNVSEHPLKLPRGHVVAQIEDVQEEDVVPWHENEEESVAKTTSFKSKVKNTPAKLTDERRQEILKKAKLQHLDPSLRERYLRLLLEYHDILSLSEFDLGSCHMGQHKIPLKANSQPAFRKQFPLPIHQQAEIKRQVKQWLKLGVIRRCESEFNSSLFCVKKKSLPGQETRWRIVQDFRSLNELTAPSNLRLPMISECLDKIGQKKASIFSSLDLRSGYYQVEIAPQDQHKTAFWVDSMGQFCWTRAAQGLAYMPFSFQRIMERIFRKQIEKQELLCYLDDILCFGPGHQDMLSILRNAFENLRKSGLLLNLEKCSFGTESLVYLGFEISKHGYAPDPQKVQDILNCPEPATLKQVRAFIGMLQFYRLHFPKFSQLIKPLSTLTGKKTNWLGGTLPVSAKKAFQYFKEKLATRPILAYPDMNLDMHLFVDASLGTIDDPDSGGVAACLVQFENNDETNPPKCLGWASRTLQKHEKNYSAFLAENLAAVFGIESFSKYLTARKFILHSDHKPMLNLNGTQKRTLERLKDILATYHFEIRHIAGHLQPSDFFSRSIPKNQIACAKNADAENMSADLNAVHIMQVQGLLGKGGISERKEQLRQEQNADPLCMALKTFIEQKRLPESGIFRSLTKRFGPQCVLQDGLVYIDLARPDRLQKRLLVAPAAFQSALIAEGHCSSYAGHHADFKTTERLLEAVWWPGISTAVLDFIKECQVCRKNAKKDAASKTFLQPLEPVSQPFVRISMDLFGPLQAENSKKWILVIVDHFSKMAEFVAIPNKTPETVADNLFRHWINRYGLPAQVLSDHGREFDSKFMHKLYEILKIDQKFTSVQHPRANAAVETLMKRIVAYLKAMVEKSPLQWENYLDSLRFCYNTSVSKATKASPFALLYGLDARTPLNELAFETRPYYGEDFQGELLNRLKIARKLAEENNMKYRASYKEYFDSKVVPEAFPEGTLVLLHQPELLKINPKIQSPFMGPFLVQSVVSEHNVVIQNLETKKTKLVNINRLRKITKLPTLKSPTVQSSVPVKNNAADAASKNASSPDSENERGYISIEQGGDIIVMNPEAPPPLPKTIKTEKSSPENPDIIESFSTPEGAASLHSQTPLSRYQNERKSTARKSLAQRFSDKITPSKETLKNLKDDLPTVSDVGNILKGKKLTRAKAAELDIAIPDQDLPKVPIEHKIRKDVKSKVAKPDASIID